MLWCKFLPFALLGCRQQGILPPDSIIQTGKLIDVSAIADLLMPPPVTVTVTVGIPASPIIHPPPATNVYHSAVPGAAVSYIDAEYIYAPSFERQISAFYEDVTDAIGEMLIALVDIQHNGRFTVPSWDLSPLHIVVAAFIFGCVHLICMIFFGDYMLPSKAVVALFRGFCTGSWVFWTAVFTTLMYLSYDVLPENPITLVISELINWNAEHDDFATRFIYGKIVSWKYFWHYSPIPEYLDIWWLMGELGFDQPSDTRGVFWPLVEQFKHTHYLQGKRKFEPKTFTELFMHVAIGFYRLGCWIFDLCSSICRVFEPSVTRLARALPGYLKALFEAIGAEMQNHGYDWYSPLRAAKAVKATPSIIWDSLVTTRGYIRHLLWHRIEARGGMPFTTNPDDAGTYAMRNALQQLGSMSVADMANYIIQHEKLKNDIQLQEPRIRYRVEKEHAAVMKELADRTLSWRTSHRELLSDYNHCRKTLDNVMRANLCSVMDMDRDDPEVQNMFMSGFVTLHSEPLSNGLHYKEPGGTYFLGGQMSDELRHKGTIGLRQIMANAQNGIRGSRYRQIQFPRRIDLYKEHTWPFDLSVLGLQFPLPTKDANLFDPNRRARSYELKELEDYVAAGRLQAWFDDMPARLQLKRGTLTDAFNSMSNKLKYKSDSAACPWRDAGL